MKLLMSIAQASGYRSTRPDDGELRDAMKAVASQRHRFGYPHHPERYYSHRDRSERRQDNVPDFRIISRKNGYELGAGWNRVSSSTGAGYVSVSLATPEFGTICGNIAAAHGEDNNQEGDPSGTPPPKPK